MMPFFSIIVPVYNGEKYIRRAISSVKEQAFFDYELLLVDDGSIDQSPFICDQIASCDSRVRVFHQENSGALLARKNGVKHASGRYHMFLDCDDTFEPNALQAIYNILKKDKLDLLLFNYFQVGENHTKSLGTLPFENGKYYSGNDLLYLGIKHTSGINNLWSKVIRGEISKKAFEKYQINMSMAEDLLISLNVFLEVKSAMFLDEYLYNYHDVPTSSMHRLKDSVFEDYDFLFNEEKKILAESGKIFEQSYNYVTAIMSSYFFYTMQRNLKYNEFKAIGEKIRQLSCIQDKRQKGNTGKIWMVAYSLLMKKCYKELYCFWGILKIGYWVKHT